MKEISELEKLKENISKGILEQLRIHNLNQKELADIINVDNSTVGKWINKKALPRMGVIQKMADCFKVGNSYFLEGYDKSNSKYSNAVQKLIDSKNTTKLELMLKISLMTDEEAEAYNKIIK